MVDFIQESLMSTHDLRNYLYLNYIEISYNIICGTYRYEKIGCTLSEKLMNINHFRSFVANKYLIVDWSKMKEDDDDEEEVTNKN